MDNLVVFIRRLRDALTSLRADQSGFNIDEFSEAGNAASGYAMYLGVLPVIEQDFVAMQTTIVHHRVFSEGCFDTAEEVIDRMESVIGARERTIDMAKSLRPSTVAVEQTPAVTNKLASEGKPPSNQIDADEVFRKALVSHHGFDRKTRSITNQNPIIGPDISLPSWTVSRRFEAHFESKGVYKGLCKNRDLLINAIEKMERLKPTSCN